MTKPDPTRREQKSRSVNDFSGDARALRGALSNMGHQPPPTTRNTPWDISTKVTQPRHESKKEADSSIIDAIGTDLRNYNDLPIFNSVVVGAAAANVDKSSDAVMDEEAMKEAMEIELRRLAVLKSYRIVGSGRNAAYERIVSLASRIFKTSAYWQL